MRNNSEYISVSSKKQVQKAVQSQLVPFSLLLLQDTHQERTLIFLGNDFEEAAATVHHAYFSLIVYFEINVRITSEVPVTALS